MPGFQFFVVFLICAASGVFSESTEIIDVSNVPYVPNVANMAANGNRNMQSMVGHMESTAEGLKVIHESLLGIRMLSEEWINPADTFEPGANVKNGHSISGQDFSTTEEYATAVLTVPIVLTVLGFLSILGFQVFFCCGCIKHLCKPNDHHNDPGHADDSASKRAAYINHQKLMVFIVEMVLCFCVLLADCLCYYGYGYIVSGGKDLLDALDMFQGLLDKAKASASTILDTAVPGMHYYVALSKGEYPYTGVSEGTCSPITGGAISSTVEGAYDGVTMAATATGSAISAAVDLLESGSDYIVTLKDYVNDYLLAYADVFVFLVFSFAAVSVALFIIFRLVRSQIGTQFTIIWASLTFILLLLVCLPFMIFASTFGDICMNPSKNIVAQAPDDELKAMLTYYSTCQGSSDIMDNFNLAKTEAESIPGLISDGFGNASTGFCVDYADNGDFTNVGLLILASQGISVGLGEIIDAASCPNIQAIWFKIVNDALCTNFYNGIYSLWVSQFITSFFLFFLILVASVSYHYFASTKVYVSVEHGEGSKPSGDSDAPENPYPTKTKHHAEKEVEMPQVDAPEGEEL